MDTPTHIAKRPPDHMFRLVTDAWTKPFWEAAAAHRLVAPRCGSCGAFRMPPTPFCPHCRAQQVSWVTLSGEGIVYSHSIVTRAPLVEMEQALPYVPAVVQLPDAGGIRLITNIVDTPIARIRIDAPASIVFDDIGNGVTIPRFRIDEDRA